MKHTCVLLLLIYTITEVISSRGDTSWIFNHCSHICIKRNCTNDRLTEFISKQSLTSRIVGWRCDEQCEHDCMWTTIEEFTNNGLRIPQFFGKWTFHRYLNLQEPASAIFSLMNGVPFFFLLRRYRRLVSPCTPMFNVWNLFMLVSMNTWFWSTVFHSHDTRFTELMDYVFAFSYVLTSLYTLCLRLIGTDNKTAVCTLSVGFMYAFYRHASYLSMGHFDYNYNMQANIIIGLVNGFGWILWAMYVWLKYYISNKENNNNKTMGNRQAYVWKVALSSLSLMLIASFEMMDFAPVYGVLDSHAIWHMATCWLPYLFYSFIIDDSRYLSEVENSKKNDKID